MTVVKPLTSEQGMASKSLPLRVGYQISCLTIKKYLKKNQIQIVDLLGLADPGLILDGIWPLALRNISRKS